MSKNNSKVKCIDLFTGTGIVGKIFSGLGCDIVFSSEKDKHARKTYKLNYGHYPTNEDITKIKPKDIPDHDILCAGFPCQSWSVNGSRKGFKDKRGKLIYTLFNIIQVKKPKVIFLENVAGLKTHNNGESFNKIKSTIENMGYKVNSEKLNSKDYGLAQNRKRLYIICYRSDLNCNFSFPKPTNEKVCIKNILESNVTKKRMTNKKHRMLIKGKIPFNNASKSNQLNPILKAWKYIAPGKEKEYQHNVIYSVEGVSPTLHTKDSPIIEVIPGDTSSWRRLTVREEARLQGFPESYEFLRNKKSGEYMSCGSKLLGNSVSVPVVKKIATNILKALQTSK